MKGNFLTKKGWLGIVTTVAVVASIAGTFAAWDTLTKTNTGNSTQLRQAVTLETTNSTAYTAANNDTYGSDVDPTYSGTVTFSATTPTRSDFHNQLVMAPTVKTSTTTDFTSATTVDTSKYSVAIKKGNTALTNNTDTSFTSGSDNTYTVSLTGLDKDTFSGQYIRVEIAGTLSQVAD